MPYVKGTPLERFYDRIIINNDDHWIFKGTHNGKGYVVFYAYGRIYAHRFAWMIYFGPIHNNFNVLHTCDIRNCVNPSHLFLGDNTDNMRDASLKGRLRKSKELREKQQRSAPSGNSHWTRQKIIRAGKTPRPLEKVIERREKIRQEVENKWTQSSSPEAAASGSRA